MSENCESCSTPESRDALLKELSNRHSNDVVSIIFTVLNLHLDRDAYAALFVSMWDSCPFTEQKFEEE